MSFVTQEYRDIGERLLTMRHKSGLSVYLIPREGGESFALFGTKYGAMDHRFRVDGREVCVPDGIAHFLEHKLFENEDGTDTFSRFAAHAASANAFTSNEMTAYLFSATENLSESLSVLLDFVTHPYFTKQTVQKEQGIIAQEIRMYEDDPDYQLYFGLLGCLYQDHPIKIDIAGTVESISQITDQTLYDCYRTFYHPKNMALVLCGGFDPAEVEALCDRHLPEESPFTLSRTPPAEGRDVAKKKLLRHFPVSMGQFAIGMKETQNLQTGEALLRRVAAQEIALHLYFGRGSDFFTRLYEQGVLSEAYQAGYQFLDSCAFSCFQGESEQLEEVLEQIKATVRLAKRERISEADLLRSKKAIYGNFMSALSAAGDLATQFLSYAFLGADLFSLPRVLASLRVEDVTERISHWDDALIAASFILPKQGE